MQREPRYGSDVIVDLLNQYGIEYAAFNPGASFRGIHDSIVNYGGNKNPEYIMCCHEEISVAIAHGYAKAAHKPMAAILHNVVGLQHAAMAIFNAWCDRVPVLLLGGTGPMDLTVRRPWIDWIHTALVQGNLVRDFVKWDDQPHNLASVPESFAQGYRLMTMEPTAPVYICYDVTIQEEEVRDNCLMPDPQKVVVQGKSSPDPKDLLQIARWLAGARYPVIIADYMGRNPESVSYLVELAELCGAAVIDKGNRMNFPNTHPLDLTGAGETVLAEADVILALDVHDLYGALHPGPYVRNRLPDVVREEAKVAHITLAPLLVRSWAADYERIQETDLTVLADTKVALPLLIQECRRVLSAGDENSARRREQRRKAIEEKHESLRAAWSQDAMLRGTGEALTPAQLALVIGNVIQNYEWVLVNGTLRNWPRRLWNWDRADCFLGGSAGGGLGYGMGASIGAALALRDSNRLCVNIQSDGDLLFTPGALWTAAHHQIPLLTVMYNNQSYYNSENHALELAKHRNTPMENSGMGTQIRQPEVGFAKLAESMGMQAFGPCHDAGTLDKVLRQAVRVVMEERKPVLVDVVVRG